ncbi:MULTISPECIES: aldo/keto reductase [unclassified Spirosoma]|uniref:aldo/keto reductase n=1 Tax=unclassified Spirosoma TaxID=2621999 RepID=UPI000969755C|nr:MULTISPECIES: aldo/keto reductase [unclassified Spirosoma]MBN8825125.1 aldo/keto reductase [Spirosoma sp.]OJW77184.1 MAG: aldo/keto reductase [Spirosoma sp. 48-14]
MQYRQLGNTDLIVSQLSFGASPLGNVFNDVSEDESIRSVHTAIDQGINFFDVAPFYGDTLAETRLGKALKNKRNSVFLATKCCRYGNGVFDFSYNRVLQSIDESLERLQVDYVDLLTVHDIEFGDREQVLNEAIPAALKVKAMGKARYVGFSGLPVRYLAQIARQVEVDTVLSWGHYTLLEDEINDELVPLSIEKGFGLMNAAPLMQRILSDAPIPPWQSSPPAVKAIQPKLIALCREYDLALSDVALNYAVRHPVIATTIVGMSEQYQVEQNLRAMDILVPDELWQRIETLVAPVKNQMWFEGKPENNIPKSNGQHE